MPQAKANTGKGDAPEKRVWVWDLPTRLFHWSVAALAIVCIVTGRLGLDWLDVHMRCGYGVLALVLFRLVWGFAGGRHARFASFVRGPAVVGRHIAEMFQKDAPRHLGHNPLGGWSVMAMLGALLLQASTGLFATDDIFTEGPLYPLASRAASDLLTRIHRLNADVIIALVAIHVLAIGFYLVVKRDNLIRPMIDGRKTWRGPALPAEANLPAAALIAAICAGVVFLVVRYAPVYLR
ncbi:MAG: cytochrome b/b6 domain-containing protein [Desulfobacterales bacterium]|nr:cytochrome b/b6 domain-containing protein [Desulfobacterales bacterium]